MGESVLLFAEMTVCATFGASFIQKALGQQEFANALGSFGIPKKVQRQCALLVTTLELLTASLVLFPGRAMLVGFALAAGLLCAFSIVLSLAITSGVTATCHCFGSSGVALSWFDVLRNVGLLTLVTTSWIIAIQSKGGVLSGGQSILAVAAGAPGQTLAILASAIVFALIWARIPELVQLIRAD